MNKKTVQLIELNNSMWGLIKTHVGDIGEFLSTREQTPEIANLIAVSVKLILSELVLGIDKYKKYPARMYTDEEFTDMVIESMVSNTPTLEDVKANEIYIDESRKVIWSHIKMHAERLVHILTLMEKPEEEREALSEKDGDIFLECLTVVWVECNLRDREARILENTYGD